MIHFSGEVSYSLQKVFLIAVVRYLYERKKLYIAILNLVKKIFYFLPATLFLFTLPFVFKIFV